MKGISSNELRELYLRFFEERDHAVIPSAPLVPENDPSVLFTTAGMHPLVPFLKGEKHPAGKRLVDVQKCLRTTDIDEVGNATHATVFEMLGNWSLGDYFKEEAIQYSWEFLTSAKWLGIDPNRLAVSVFAGDDNAPRDEESAGFWKEVGVPPGRIAYLDSKENWWPSFAPPGAGATDGKPVGGLPVGPQGPDTEMFYWIGGNKAPKKFDTEDKNWVEIWNDVFIQYDGDAAGSLTDLSQQNVDTGMGLERTVMVLNGQQSIYEIDSAIELMKLIEGASQQEEERHKRILADHIKAATFVLGDEHPVTPSNTERGYVLRRIIRRAVRSANQLGVVKPGELMTEGVRLTVKEYGKMYGSLVEHQEQAQAEIKKEAEKFTQLLVSGERKIAEYLQNRTDINGQQAFELYSTYGYPVELIEEVARERKVGLDMGGFEEALKKHSEASRAAAGGKFAGGLADHSEMSIKYHTATHLLHQALREVLGDQVVQKGSNITAKRLRFDFSHPDKMSDAEKQKVEEIVNEQIKAELDVSYEEVSVAEGKKMGALGLFEAKYGDKVKVYKIGDFSVEICGGPHVRNTKELGIFEIIKEQAVGAGTRRIKSQLV